MVTYSQHLALDRHRAAPVGPQVASDLEKLEKAQKDSCGQTLP